MRARRCAIDPLSLYLHIPFCHSRCRYCAFNTYAGLQELHRAYVEALAQEIALWGEALSSRWQVQTIYFGGGTPSILPPQAIGRLLEACHQAFSIAPETEISLEANPGTVDGAALRALRATGVNRLSFGVQSFQSRWLQFLGRMHSAEEALVAFDAARKAGFENLNLDFIFGLPPPKAGEPAQTTAEWEADLRQAVALGPEHLSCYALIIEEGTTLAHWRETGRIPEPDPDLAADLYELAESFLEGAGYQHYEICNWAQPGHRCRHNLTYWRNEPYLGLGPGAHSFLPPYRFGDLELPQEYIRRLEHHKRPLPNLRALTQPGLQAMPAVGWVEHRHRLQDQAETAILGLRLTEGISRPRLALRFGVDPAAQWGPLWAEMEDLGLVEVMPQVIRLTPRGRLLGNEVFYRLLPEEGAGGI